MGVFVVCAREFEHQQHMNCTVQKLGFSEFREGQLEALYSISTTEDHIAVDCVFASGTGHGKTLPGILPQIMYGGTVLNVCPLSALADDQLAKLHSFKLQLKTLKLTHNGISSKVLQRIREGFYQFSKYVVINLL